MRDSSTAYETGYIRNGEYYQDYGDLSDAGNAPAVGELPPEAERGIAEAIAATIVGEIHRGSFRKAGLGQLDFSSVGTAITSAVNSILPTAMSVYAAKIAGKEQAKIEEAKARAADATARAAEAQAQAAIALSQKAPTSALPSWALPVGGVVLVGGAIYYFMSKKGRRR